MTEAIRTAMEALRWYEQFSERPGEDANERFERIAEAFHRDTGYLRPGKDCRMYSPEERQAVWSEWCDRNIAKARTAIATLTAEMERPAPALLSTEVSRIAFEILRRHNDDGLWRALTYDSGPYDVTMPKLVLDQLAEAFFAAGVKAATPPAERPVPEPVAWISVEDRLPEKFTEVLIAFKENSLPSTGQYTDNPNDHDGWCFPKENADWTDGSWPTVVAWMPLPDHPHEEWFATAPQAKDQT